MTLPIYGQPSAPAIDPAQTTLPATPPPFYPMSLDGLQIRKQFSRASFAADFGCQPPAFDPSWPLQAWFDPQAVASEPYAYLAVQQAPGGAFVFEPWSIAAVVIPGARAAVPNLPGRPVYPPYAPAPTTATSDGKNLVNPSVLSTEAQALALSALLPGTSVISGPGLQTLDGDGRNDYMIQGGGLWSAYYVGTLLLDQYADGVGAPGHWTVQNGGAIWVPDPQAADGITSGIPRSFQAVPCRALLPAEYIQSSIFGALVFSR